MTQYVITIDASSGEAKIDGRMMVDWDSVSDNPDENANLQLEMLFARDIEAVIDRTLKGCTGIKIEENENGSEG